MENGEARAIIRECAAASAAGRTGFGEVVIRLSAAGVERYQVDFQLGDTRYYLADGTVEVVASHHGVVASGFSADGIAAAVRGAQAGTLAYPEFCRLVMAAGCVGYVASMVGKRVVYSGRTGDAHVEWFPNAKE
ncbi:MAG TPA: DUF1398 family protein [Acetobacteraceae bacterium]|jgi:uncharacterized protein YbcV (DUF1398 family)|nr:DUF1398 family protein [Acetobacteraceae bacterium]